MNNNNQTKIDENKDQVQPSSSSNEVHIPKFPSVRPTKSFMGIKSVRPVKPTGPTNIKEKNH